MTTGRSTVIAGAAVLSLLLATAAHAWIEPSRLNHLTFSGAVGLPGVTLAAGTYVFEVAEINPQIVRVLSRDGSTHYFTGFTRTVRRPASRGVRDVTFAEAQPGTAPRIAVWYPVGALRGHQFLYESK